MDNRDDDEDRLEAVTPSGNDDWTDDEEGDTYSISSGLRDDLSEANAMDDDSSPFSDPDTSDDMVAQGEDDAGQAPEKDWLVDSGLAAAIRPETAGAEPQTTPVPTGDADAGTLPQISGLSAAAEVRPGQVVTVRLATNFPLPGTIEGVAIVIDGIDGADA